MAGLACGMEKSVKATGNVKGHASRTGPKDYRATWLSIERGDERPCGANGRLEVKSRNIGG